MNRVRRKLQHFVWPGFALPGVAWLIAFFVVPVYAILSVAFGDVDPFIRTPIPRWNPLDWNADAMSSVLHRVFGGDLGKVFTRTFSFVFLALLGCIIVGYPVAYFVARAARRSRGLLLTLLVLPFWISYLMRMLAWTNLLHPDGYVNQILRWLHLIDQPKVWLDGNGFTIVIGLIYGYVPFFILPLYSTLERIDQRLIDAGRDLGASAMETFMRVTLPLSVPGLMAASVITILPMAGDYYTNTYLSGGAPRAEMVGNQIEHFLHGSSQPNKGAALVLILMAMLTVLMVYYLITTVRQQRMAER